MKIFQFYINKPQPTNSEKIIYFFTNLARSNTASGVVLTLHNNGNIELHHTNRDTINAMPSLYDEVDEDYINNLLKPKSKENFITLFFAGIDKCL